ncbi:Uncharacterized [Moorella glycerini]|uniref:Uncharacterized protein n=1 Tax=Neomoorella stamsii TaxID=1266720 RepID=A0A9X7P4U5_9FIRM|nr:MULTISPECIES: hypothetical protein [Moorella]PRR69570.1 hypothetical protein MOST_29920 [Moorella stamsii]CEP67906.1 Uncharacterized [Moorella glycerini]CEP68776.1 Uncharacterized [Moorella glycerini]
MATVWDVDEWVRSISSLPIVSFYPTAVAKATGLPLTDVFNRLLYLVNDGKLRLLWEIRCPNYDCVRTLEIVDDPKKIIGKSIYCTSCGEEIEEISSDNIFPAFQISPEYKARVIKKKRLTAER